MQKHNSRDHPRRAKSAHKKKGVIFKFILILMLLVFSIGVFSQFHKFEFPLQSSEEINTIVPGSSAPGNEADDVVGTPWIDLDQE